MSREAVEALFARGALRPIPGATVEETFRRLRAAAAAARETVARYDPAFAAAHPLDDEEGLNVARRLVALGEEAER